MSNNTETLEGKPPVGDSVDGNTGTPSQTTETVSGSEPNRSDAPNGTLTQEQVNALVGDARTKSRQKAQEDLIAQLGVSNLEEAQRLLKRAKDEEQAQMTELEQAQAKIAALATKEQEAADLSTKVTEYEAAMQKHLAGILKELEVPEHITMLTSKMPVQEQLTYFTENRSNFSKASVPNVNGADKGGNRATSTETPEQKSARLRIKYGI
jgi:hypothetical protein